MEVFRHFCLNLVYLLTVDVPETPGEFCRDIQSILLLNTFKIGNCCKVLKHGAIGLKRAGKLFMDLALCHVTIEGQCG